jgi:hypothetical protein
MSALQLMVEGSSTGVTSNGELWHTIRTDPFPSFQDVELIGGAGDRGTFQAVGVA